ncbi:MAG: AbrB/MazE/SpoVT family DNA-binding domain-containing protein [Hydrogenothermaceae bacterium]|nr:AbrB/MazE/SpoVT family DNA-binding domain-containing protein [Hydrogenothermaceae bacterium]
MIETKIIKDKDGYLIKIPKDFEILEDEEIYIDKHNDTLIIYPKSKFKWEKVYKLLEENAEELKDFLEDRKNYLPEEKEIF